MNLSRCCREISRHNSLTTQVYDVFHDDESEGWRAVYKSLKAGVGARFAKKEGEEDKWGSEFMGEVGAVFEKHGKIFDE